MKIRIYELVNQTINILNNTPIKSSILIGALLLLVTTSACDDDTNSEPIDDGKPSYAIWLQLGSWPNTTQYVVGSNDLTTGSVSLEGNGAEVTSKADYGIIPKNGYYYYPSTSSDFGKMSQFEFKDNQLNVVREVPYTFQNSIGSFSWIDDNTLLLIGTNGSNTKVVYSVVDATTLEITNGELELPTIPEGYFYYSEGIVEYSNGKIFLTYGHIVDWPDLGESGINIAVIDYPSFEVEKVIKSNEADGKSGSSMWMPTSTVDESGNIYILFYADWFTLDSSPSKIFKIRNGSTELDASYDFDIGAALGGEKVVGFWYTGNGRAIVKYEDSQLLESNPNGLHYIKFALIDVESTSVIKKLDLPADKGVSINNVILDEGRVFAQINDETNADYVWEINTTTGDVTAGLQIDGGFDYILRLDNLK